MENFRLIDIRTGEDLTTDYTIRSNKQVDAYRAKQRREQGFNFTRFVASHHDPILNVIRDLSLVEAGVILRLLPHIKTQTGGRVTLTTEEIAKLVGRSRQRLDISLKSLCNAGILSKQRTGKGNVYTVSEEYHSYGVSLGKGARFTKVYREAADHLLSKVSLETAGFLYKIQPFLHYELCFLTSTPEAPSDAMETMGALEMARELDISDRDVYRHLSILKKNGALMRVSTGERTGYIVHPDLMFRLAQETDWSTKMRGMFKSLTK